MSSNYEMTVRRFDPETMTIAEMARPVSATEVSINALSKVQDKDHNSTGAFRMGLTRTNDAEAIVRRAKAKLKQSKVFAEREGRKRARAEARLAK